MSIIMERLSVKFFICLIISIAQLSCIGGANAKKDSTTFNVADSITDKTKTELPFDYEDWINWQSKVDQGEGSDDRYTAYYVETSEWLNNIFHSKNRADTAIYCYFILDQNHVQYETFLLRTATNNGLFFKILNVNKEGNIISELPLSSAFPDVDTQKGFNITSDMKIYTYQGMLKFNEYENRGIIENKKTTGVYQVRNDGVIVKIEN